MFTRGVTRRAARLTRKSFTFTRLSVEVAGKTFFAKFLNGWMIFIRWVKRKKRCDARLRVFIGHGSDAKLGVQISLCPKRKADIGNRACIGGLNAGGHALDMMTIIRFAAAMTIVSPTGRFHYAESGWIRAAAHGAVSKVCIKCEAFTAMTANAAKGFNRMRYADLWQIRVARGAVFSFA